MPLHYQNLTSCYIVQGYNAIIIIHAWYMYMPVKFMKVMITIVLMSLVEVRGHVHGVMRVILKARLKY